MPTVATATPTVSHRRVRARAGAALLASLVVVAVVLATSTSANAAMVPTVPLGTTTSFSVVADETVTNANGTTMDRSIGLSPGTSVTGFPPGLVNAPGTIQIANGVADQAQLDLGVAYTNAAGRSVDETTAADLGGRILQGGVYAGPSKGALGLTGPLVLDGAGSYDTVFIFQTDSTLITESSSTVSLINGAQACNVFWQVGSSATLGTDSTFVGNILAMTSITLTSRVTIDGRAMALEGAVTMDDDTFISSACNTGLVPPPVTVPTTAATTIPTTAATTVPTTAATTTPAGPTSSSTPDRNVTPPPGQTPPPGETPPGETPPGEGNQPPTRSRTPLPPTFRTPVGPPLLGPPQTGAPVAPDAVPAQRPLLLAFAGLGTLGTVGLLLLGRRAPQPARRDH